MTSILGTRVLRSEDPRFLTSGGDYIESVELPGALHVAYVHSTIAHARLDLVDTGDAQAMPGVVTVVSGADVDLEPLGPPHARMPAAMARPLIATDTVRFVGEIVAAVVAETRAQAVDAAESVIVAYEPLPAVVDPDSTRRDEILLFPEAGTNTAFSMPSRATTSSRTAMSWSSSASSTNGSRRAPSKCVRPRRAGNRTAASRNGHVPRDRTGHATSSPRSSASSATACA